MNKVIGLVTACALAFSGTAILATPADAAAKPVKYKNCTALNKKYPHGAGLKGAKDKVKSGKPVTNFKIISKDFYSVNKKMDRDKDKVICEKR